MSFSFLSWRASWPQGDGDFAAAGFADVAVDAGGAEGGLEGEHGLAGGAFDGELGDFVVIDQIHVGADLAGDGGELARACSGSVLPPPLLAIQHDEFEGDFAAGFFKVRAAGFYDLGDGNFVGPGV